MSHTSVKGGMHFFISMKKYQFVLTICLFMSLLTYGRAYLSPYAASYMHRHERHTRSAANDDMLMAYIYLEEEADRGTVEALGVKIGLDLGSVVTAQIPLNSVDRLCCVPGVKYITMGHAVQPMLNNARKATHADDMLAGVSLPESYSGKGVVVGIIDAGFDYTHPAFYDSALSTNRIKRVWEQSTETTSIDGASSPQTFGYGMEFDTPEEILAACADREGNSHGTHVAGIAAGGDVDKKNPYYGVANQSDIVLVSYGELQENNVNISDAIAYIYDYAASVGKPCVINMSLGTQLGPHDGSSAFDQVADMLQGNGRLLVGSAGNFGAVKLHVSNKDGKAVSTGINYMKVPSASNVGGDIDIWGDSGTSFTLKISVINKSTGLPADESVEYSVDSQESAYTFTPASPTRGEINIFTEINPLNGKPHAFVSSGISSLRSSNFIALTVTPTDGGTVHMWADGSKVTLTDGGLENFADGDSDYTLAEIGGTGKRIISVGAFVTSKGQGQAFSSDNIGAIASFSSKGPAVDDRMKPDITAPGTYIVSSLSSYATPVAGSEVSSLEWNDRIYKYGYMEGTSMAAPFITGVVASWLQAYPEMTPEELREILSLSADKDDFTNSSAVVNGTWGYGKINALEGAKEAVKMASVINLPKLDNDSRNVIISVNDGIKIISAVDAPCVKADLVDITGKKLNSVTFRNVYAGQQMNVASGSVVSGIYFIVVECKGLRTIQKVVI